MTTDADTTAVWEVVGDAEPSDQLVASIARLLLSLDGDAAGQEQEA